MGSRRLRFSVASLGALASFAGCAQLIGAEFDGAKLAGESDASLDAAATETSNDGASLDGTVATDAPLADATFDARAIGDGGLTFWLAADFGVEAGAAIEAGVDAAPLVSVWGDQSGLARDVTAAAQKPSLVVDDAGLPVVRFERARGTYFVSPKWNGPVGVTGTTIFVVARGTPDSLVRFQGPSVPQYLVFPWNRGNLVADAGTDHFLLVSNGFDAQKIRARFDDGRMNVGVVRIELGQVGGMRTYRNGVALETSSLFGDAMPTTDGFTLGCSYLATECAEADVGEVMIYGSALPDAERAAVEQYLFRKWSIVP